MEDFPSKEIPIIKSPEEIALSKVREIDVPGTLFYVTTVDQLESIIEHGIISENAAKYLGIKYDEKRWGKRSDSDSVYIGINKEDEREDFRNLEKFALQLSNEFSQIAVIILHEGVAKTGRRSTGFAGEPQIEVKNRIAPFTFIGIAVGGSVEDRMEYMPDRGKITSLSRNQKRVDSLMKNVLQIMQKKFSTSPGKFLPVYDLRGNLLWPKRMLHEETVGILTERQK